MGRTKLSMTDDLKQPSYRIEEAGVTLNAQKCEFNKRKITFLCHIIDVDSIRADPGKNEAIRKMNPPTSVTELRRFME